jgi:5-methylthioribose kinase
MLELTEGNLLDYLRQRRWIGSGPARATTLSGGVSNVVFRVQTSERDFVVKQSRPRLRTRDAWFSDLERVYREQQVMEILHALLPDNVPEVLFADRDNYAFAMSAAPAEAEVWKALLLAGNVDLGLGARTGSLLGSMHQASAEQPALVKPFGDHTAFVQLRVNPFYRRVQERRPEVAAPVQYLIEQMLTVREGLCHGDYTPKNLLIHDSSLLLVDYETAHHGDPTMDLGLCLCHFLLKAIHRPDRRHDYFDLTRAFWRGYTGVAGFRSARELQKRGIAHGGACLLARVDGTSPALYLTEPARMTVRRLGTRVLLEQPAAWEEILAMCDQELAVP